MLKVQSLELSMKNSESVTPFSADVRRCVVFSTNYQEFRTSASASVTLQHVDLRYHQ